MPNDIVNFPMGGGLNRAKASHLSSPDDFYELFNFRPSRDEEGAIEQTPYFTLNKQFDRGTVYVSGVSTTESSDSRVRGVYSYTPTKRLVVTDFCAWAGVVGSLTQQQIFVQDTSVTGTDIHGNCLITIGNVTTAAITLGSSIDIEIDGGTTFKWRINGGAYTTGVTILAAGNALGATTITVFFLTTTGFTAGWWWHWTRRDQLLTASAVLTADSTSQLEFVPYKNNVYFTAPNHCQVFKLVDPGSTPSYVISAGYQPFTARNLANFGNHLIASGYNSPTLSSSNALLCKTTGIAWSDRDNFDNFFATDVNEADFFFFPTEFSELNVQFGAVRGIIVLATQLFVVVHDAIWRTPYLGLPTVFNFEKAVDFMSAGYTQFSTAIPGPGPTVYCIDNAAVLFSVGGLVLFDGTNLRNIGGSVAYLFNETAQPSGYAYLSAYDELYIDLGGNSGLVVWQRTTNRWHRRAKDFTGVLSCLGTTWEERCLLVGDRDRKLLAEDVTWTAQPVFDTTAGTLYATPLFTKHLTNAGSFSKTKETTGFTTVAAAVTSVSSTYYSSTTNLRVITPTTVSAAMPSAITSVDEWDLGNADMSMTGPRFAFRAFTMELNASGTVNGKPPGQLVVYGLEVTIRGFHAVER